jgi:hypothetical protein
VECTFTNSSTTRPVIISDGGSGNDKTVYPTQANVETVATFIPKTTGSDDITIKTTGSSGQTVTKVILYGNTSSVYAIWQAALQLHVNNGTLTADLPVDIYNLQAGLIASKVNRITLHKGIYVIKYQNLYSKIIIN